MLARDWEGQPVFILAGGPSVSGHDLSLLAGFKVIAINSAHLSYPGADILYYTDCDWWTSVGSKEPPFAGQIVTTDLGGHKNAKSIVRLTKIDPGKGFSSNPQLAAVSATSVSGALHIAIHKGGNPVFLLGVDGKVGPGGRRHHHDGRYKGALGRDWANRHRVELERLARSIKPLGIDIHNCSPVSELTCWPKTSFEDAVLMAQAALKAEPAPPSPFKAPLVALGMYGMGDCLHQRAVVRELMKTRQVELQTYYTAIYHDLIDQGLKVTLVERPNLPPRIRDGGNAPGQAQPARLQHADMRIGYDHARTKKHGTLLAAMFGSAGLAVPDKADFSLPVKEEWRSAAWALMDKLGHPMDVSNAGSKQFATINGKPLMIYRPIIVNGTWPCPSRSPDPAAYAALYRAIKDRFFVVSVCDLTQKGEEIVGEEQDADLKLHRGEAPFETLAGLFSQAALVFGNAGFTPILAQAVGTPTIVVYGGNESFRYTNIAGAHLAPTLAIEPVKPCECFDRHHKCDKTIRLAAALPKVEAFAAAYAATPRVLVFGTTYVDTEARAKQTAQWRSLHRHVNDWTVDLMLIDSASPVLEGWLGEGDMVYRFPDNIGHLARGGKDGWGRAFSKGLEIAIDGQYDFVVHIEGDSLFSKPVLPIVRRMMAEGIKAASVPVAGTKRQETGWAETGLMFFSVDYLWQTKFIEKYDWSRQPRPFPEQAIFDILGQDLVMLDLKAARGDKGQITAENAAGFDWITHCAPEAFDAFVESATPPSPLVGEDSKAGQAEGEPLAALGEGSAAPQKLAPYEHPSPRSPSASASPQRGDLSSPTRGEEEALRLNFGCGTNRLEGWQNFDAELDITKPLPFADSSADRIYAEHVVEHVDYRQALAFFAECRRVLKPGGVIRIAVPSLENIWKRGDQEYFNFAKRWAPSADRRGAMHAIVNAHGHKAIWTQGLLEACLFYAGFEEITACETGKSSHADLVAVEGHGRVIGERFNWIETAVVEGTRL